MTAPYLNIRAEFARTLELTVIKEIIRLYKFHCYNAKLLFSQYIEATPKWRKKKNELKIKVFELWKFKPQRHLELKKYFNNYKSQVLSNPYPLHINMDQKHGH